MDENASPAAPAEPAVPADPAAPEVPAEPGAPIEVKAGQVPSLDQLHNLTIAKLDAEPAAPAEPEVPEEPAAPEEPPAPEEPAAPAPELPAAPAEPAPERPEPAALDTDTSKPGEGKVAVQSFDGKTYYFNNASEVPGDFEPLNFAETVKANQAFVEKAQSDSAAEAEAAKTEADAVTAQQEQQAVTALHQSWNADIAAMTTEGLLPADPKEAATATQEVYDYMGKQSEAGVSADNFREAWKAVQYEHLSARQTAEQKKLDDAKKKAGGMVQPAGGGAAEAETPAPGQSRVLKAPPSGVGLDAVHNHYTSELHA